MEPLTSADLAGGDEIELLEVRGDRRQFEAGGTYCIRGRCTLRSVPAGLLKIVRLENLPAEGSEPEELGRAELAGTGEFAFRVRAGQRKMFGFQLQVVSADGSKSIGTFDVMNWGC